MVHLLFLLTVTVVVAGDSFFFLKFCPRIEIEKKSETCKYSTSTKQKLTWIRTHHPPTPVINLKSNLKGTQ